LGDALRNKGKFEESAHEFEAARTKKPDSLPALYAVAESKLALKDWTGLDGAIAALDRMGHRGPAEELRGMKAFAQADFAAALQHFRNQANPGDDITRSRAFWFQAAALAETGRLSEAEAALRSGMEQDERLGLPEQKASKRIALGYLKLREGDLAAAGREALEAASLATGPKQLLQAAMVLCRAGAPGEASALRDRIVKVAPGTQMAQIAGYLIQGEQLLTGGRASEAIEPLERAKNLDSALRLRVSLALAYEGAGQLPRALALFERDDSALELIFLGPDILYPGQFTDILFQHANCAMRLGHRAIARELLEVYLQRRQTAGGEAKEVVQARQLLAQTKSSDKE
jgi:tetratricopeptide (TPR) repeat protein